GGAARFETLFNMRDTFAAVAGSNAPSRPTEQRPGCSFAYNDNHAPIELVDQFTYDHIRRHKLFLRERLNRLAVNGGVGKVPPSPAQSIVMKCNWDLMTTAEEKSKHYTVHVQVNVNRLGQAPRLEWQDFGLVSLHLTSREIPNWTWATLWYSEHPERDLRPSVE